MLVSALKLYIMCAVVAASNINLDWPISLFQAKYTDTPLQGTD